MNQFYRAIGTSKQNVYQRVHHQFEGMEQEAQLEKVVHQIRQDHPRMGMKTLYLKLKPTWGREAFFSWYRKSGFKVANSKNWRRTTDSSGVVRFPNLVEGISLTSVNQVWVSDITYFELKGQFYYLTFVMDQYSRKIKGYSVSSSLKTSQTTVVALERALLHLKVGDKPIFHSDGGGQYYSKMFLSVTKGKFINSMGKTAYENPHAERLNRTIKNDYIKPYNPRNFRELNQCCSKAVKMYNQGKPHSSIDGLTPDQFEIKMTRKISSNNRQKTVNLI